MRRFAFLSLALALVGTVTVSSRLLLAQTSSAVSRAEAVALILSNVMTDIPQHKNNGRFPDLQDTDPRTPAMLEAIARGMLDPHATFGLLYPYGPVTRVQFLKLATIGLKLPKDLPQSFQDVPADAWFKPYAGLACAHELFPGAKTFALLQPHALLTHADAAAVMGRIKAAYPENIKVEKPTVARLYPALERRQPSPTGGVIPRAVIESATRTRVASQATTQQVRAATLQQYMQDEEMTAKARVKIVELTNAERAKEKLPPLKIDALLQAAAQKHAKDLWNNNYFDHHSQDGRSYVDRIRLEGYFDATPPCGCDLTCFCRPRFAVGENLAKGQISPEQAVKEWMASPGHRSNLLQVSFDEIGVGIFGTVWVQNFGKIEMVKEYVEVR